MIALLLSAALSPAPQDLGAPAAERPAFDTGALELDLQVFHDVDAAGDLWARGERWKMRFGPDGATFFPLFGPGQERHHPLALSPASVRLGSHELIFDRAAAAARDGDRVLFDRGPWLEVYDLAPEEVEQSFVFPVVPRGGDLALRLETACDLPGAAGTLGGIELVHELGRLAYSQAVAIDGLGRRLSVETILDGSAIRILVPAAFLDAAVAPLVIDPLLHAWTMPGSGSAIELLPDVSFDASTQRWLVAWERPLTATDSDIVYRLLDDAGIPISSGYLNLDTQRWTTPSVANVNAKNTFYVAARVQGLTSWSIQGRVLPASAPDGSSGGPVYQLGSALKTKPSQEPEVGGDPSTDPSHGFFCVVWRDGALGSADIRFRRVDSKGVPQGSQATLLSGPDGAYQAGISASNDGLEWTVAYGAVTDAFGTSQLTLARIAWSGEIMGAPVVLPPHQYGKVQVSSRANGKQLIATQESSSIHLVAVQGTQVLDEEDFATLGIETQLMDFDLAVDGQRFVLGYRMEKLSGIASITVEPVADQIATVEHTYALTWVLPTKGEMGLASRQEAGGLAGKALLACSRASGSYPFTTMTLGLATYQAE